MVEEGEGRRRVNALAHFEALLVSALSILPPPDWATDLGAVMDKAARERERDLPSVYLVVNAFLGESVIVTPCLSLSHFCRAK